jgi:protein-tyrosine phosphatase
MIDLHCHLLPGVDDGARDLETGLALARAAVANGIRAAVLTPHVFPGRWSLARRGLRPHFNAFRRMVEEARIPLELHLGAEVRLAPESLALFAEGELPTIGHWQGRPVVLIELPDGGLPPGALGAIEVFLEGGAVPMIAHPERNRAVMRDPDRIAPFVEAGCLLQLTAASVCGWFGEPALHAARALIDRGWVTVVATDAHDLRHRPPVLREARHALRMRWGETAAVALTETTPASLLGPTRDGRRREACRTEIGATGSAGT